MYCPLIFIRPYAAPCTFYFVCGIEGEGGFGGHDFDFYAVVLEWVKRLDVVLRPEKTLTCDSCLTIKGAFTEATLPVVMSNTCVKPSSRSFWATKARLEGRWSDIKPTERGEAE